MGQRNLIHRERKIELGANILEDTSLRLLELKEVHCYAAFDYCNSGVIGLLSRFDWT